MRNTATAIGLTMLAFSLGPAMAAEKPVATKPAVRPKAPVPEVVLARAGQKDKNLTVQVAPDASEAENYAGQELADVLYVSPSA